MIFLILVRKAVQSSAPVSALVPADVPAPADGVWDTGVQIPVVPFAPERGPGGGGLLRRGSVGHWLGAACAVLGRLRLLVQGVDGGRGVRKGSAGRGWRLVAGLLAVVVLVLPVSACGGNRLPEAKPTLTREEAIARAKERYASAEASASAAGLPWPPTPSASPSAAPSLSPEAQASKDQALATPLPPRLERMDENSPEGASQAAKYFMLLYTYTYTTGDTKPWQDITEEECKFCENLVNVTKELHDNGGWADHWNIEIYTITHRKPGPDYNYTVVDIELTNPGTTEYDAFGNGSQTDREENKVLRLGLNYVGGRWMIHGGQVLK
ncbi:DUF6318 family protein [Actinomyces weissii]|uniref:DUF6318 domain-containing protein n=1 Tax=Actinomyces weissii TaxID=675090 RepID=A0A7T7S2S0_9ACTO|nr:DUF6318 family protein [Actinomyces weissii]QQM67980.1 hypothetical protein JG540_03735 [Actinomyces weissii]